MTTQWKVLTDKKGNPTGNLVTPLFRASFVALFEPKGFGNDPNSEKKYSLVMLFAKGTDFSPLVKRIQAVADEAWGAKAAEVLKKQANSTKNIFKDQGELAEKYAGFEEGRIYLQAANKRQPGLVGRKAGPDGTLIEITSEEIFFSGCYAVAEIAPYAWDNKFGKGISLSLNNVQMICTGERLGGGRTRPSDAFEAGDDEEDGMLDETTVKPQAVSKDPFA